LRGEARKNSHKAWRVAKFARCDLERLNRHISVFPSVVYVSKSPEMWSCGPPPQPSAAAPSPLCDDAEPTGFAAPAPPPPPPPAAALPDEPGGTVLLTQ
jgi:hypothetical protein